MGLRQVRGLRQRVGAVAGQFADLVAHALVGGERGDGVGLAFAKGLVEPLDPPVEAARREPAEQGDAGDRRQPGKQETEREPTQQRGCRPVLSRHQQAQVRAELGRPGLGLDPAGKRDPAAFGYARVDPRPGVKIACQPRAARAEQEVVRAVSVAGREFQPVADPRDQFALPAAGMDIGEPGQVDVDRPFQRRCATRLHRPVRQRPQQRDQCDRHQCRPQRDPPEDGVGAWFHARGISVHRAGGSLFPRSSPARAGQSLPPACGAGGRC